MHINNQRSAVVAVMRSWLGKNEADGSHKEIIDLYNTILPHPFDYEVKYEDAWCAAALSAAFHQAGLDELFPMECSCRRMVEKAKEMGIWQERDDYIPLPGDCLLFDREDSGEGDNEGRPNHIGMVEKVSEGIITTIEGNYEDAVKRREIPVNGRYIRGFVTPKFDDTAIAEAAKAEVLRARTAPGAETGSPATAESAKGKERDPETGSPAKGENRGAEQKTSMLQTVLRKGKGFLYRIGCFISKRMWLLLGLCLAALLASTAIKVYGTNSRNTVVSIMQSWVGKNEADGSHKEIIDIYNTIDPLPVNYTVTYEDAWCAATVSAAFHVAGYDGIFPSECSCTRMMKTAMARGIWQEYDAYVPMPGDCILYNWDGAGEAGNTGRPTHIGMVEKVSGNVITVIEGNEKKSVKRRKISVGSRYIRGFVTPRFTDVKGAAASAENGTEAELTLPQKVLKKAKALFSRGKQLIERHFRLVAGLCLAAALAILAIRLWMDYLKRKAEGREAVPRKAKELLSRANRFIDGHVGLCLGLCFVLMLGVTALKFRVYPQSAFKDANFIVSLTESGDLSEIDSAYTLITVLFSSLFRLVGTADLEVWGWILFVPGAAMALFLLYKARPRNLLALIAACGFSGLLPFYVFGVGKEFLQFTVFFLIALALMALPKEWMKVGATVALLIPVTLFFRSYYVLMIGFTLLFYIFALVYRRRLTAKDKAICLMGTAILVVAGLYLIRFVFPQRAQYLFTVRSTTNAAYGRTASSDKVIMDLLPLEQSVPGFLANYLFAALRMVLPLELLKNIGDIPFVVFQLAVTALFVRELVKSRRVQARTAVYSAALAFFFMSFVFEPDFASWFRHEAAAFPILWLALGSDKKTDRGVNMAETDGN